MQIFHVKLFCILQDAFDPIEFRMKREMGIPNPYGTVFPEKKVLQIDSEEDDDHSENDETKEPADINGIIAMKKVCSDSEGCGDIDKGNEADGESSDDSSQGESDSEAEKDEEYYVNDNRRCGYFSPVDGDYESVLSSEKSSSEEAPLEPEQDGSPKLLINCSLKYDFQAWLAAVASAVVHVVGNQKLAPKPISAFPGNHFLRTRLPSRVARQ